MKLRTLLFATFLATPISGLYAQTGNVGIGTQLPTNTLDVNGTARIRTTTQVAGTNAVTPLYADANGVVVKASPSPTFGALTSATSATIASGAAGTLITDMADGSIYKATVIVGDACGDVAIGEFYINAISANGLFSINGLGGNLGSGAINQSPTFTQTVRNIIGVTWTDKVGCAGGDNPTAFNYTLTLSPATTLTVTNNGNIDKTYTVILTKMN